MKFKKIFILILLSIFILPALAFAINFEVGEEIFSSETINDDYYAAGETIQMESDVNGDVIAGGSNIVIDSTISQDLALVGVNIVIRGEVGDDARLAGGNIIISSIIKDDLIIGAGDIKLTDTGFVGGDFIFGGNSVLIDGMINGNVLASAGNIYINNEIKGNVKLFNVKSVEFGPNGKVLGNFSYRSSEQSEDVNEKTVKGEIEYNAIKIKEKEMLAIGWGLLAGFSIFNLLTILLVGLILLALFRFCITNTVQKAYKKPLQSVGLGFLILIVTPIVAILTLVTVIGYPFFLILIPLWLIFIYIAKFTAMMMIGMKIIKLKDSDGFLKTFGTFIIGALIFILLTIIPIVGWILKFILVLMGLGAITLYKMELFRGLRKKKLV